MARTKISRKMGWGGFDIPKLFEVVNSLYTSIVEMLNANATGVTDETLTQTEVVTTYTFANDNVVEGTESFTQNRPELVSLEITAGAADAGDLVITLDDDVAETISLLATDDTPEEVATKVAAGTWAGWTASVDESNSAVVNFVSDANETKGANSLSAGAGTKQVETATVVGTIGAAGAGNAEVIVTAAGMTNSPKTVEVAVANDDTAAQVAGKIRTALGLDEDVSAFFTISGADAEVILTAKAEALNDETLNVSIDNGTCTGLTTAATSADTTPGVAPLGVTGDFTSVQVGGTDVAIASSAVASIDYAYANESSVASVTFNANMYEVVADYSHVASMPTALPNIVD